MAGRGYGSGIAFGGANRYEIYLEGLSEYLKMLSDDMQIVQTKNMLELSIDYLKSLRGICYEIMNMSSNLLIDSQNCIRLIDAFLGKTQNYNWHNFADENMYEVNSDLNDVINGISEVLKDNADLKNVLRNKFNFSYNLFSKISSVTGAIGKVNLGLDMLSDGINNFNILSNIKSSAELVDEYIVTLQHIDSLTTAPLLKAAIRSIIDISRENLTFYEVSIGNVLVDNISSVTTTILEAAKKVRAPVLAIFETVTTILNGIFGIGNIVRNTVKVRGLVMAGDALHSSLLVCISNARHISSLGDYFYNLGYQYHDYRMEIISYFDIRICAENAYIGLCQNNFGTMFWWLSDNSSRCIARAESRIRQINNKKSWYLVC